MEGKSESEKILAIHKSVVFPSIELKIEITWYIFHKLAQEM